MSDKFTHIGSALSLEQDGKVVSLRCWIHRKRGQKELIFLILRDSTGQIQAIIKKDSEAWKEAEKITVESSCEITGKVKQDRRAPTGYELQVTKLKIVGLSEAFPIQKDFSAEYLRKVRHLWVRSTKLVPVFKIRSKIFKVDYFGEPAYLTQSWQLYAEALMFGLEKIYCIAPSFRAEKSRTRRHLSEYWHHEMETAWMEFDDLLKFQEELIIFIVWYVLKHCEKELKELGRDTSDLKKITAPFKRLKYKDALKMLGKSWGYDLTDDDERKLVADLGQLVFLTHFPRDMKAFYMKVDSKDKKVVLAADLLIPGVGETIGGSQRIDDEKELTESIKLFKLKPKDYDWYIDLRKYGSVPHSGFGLGMERLVMWLSGTEHIMDTIPFPRTKDRLEP